MGKMTAVISGLASENRAEFIQERLTTDWDVLVCNKMQEPERFAELMSTASALIGAARQNPGECPNLKLWMIPFTGYEWLDPADLPNGVTFCNTHEHETTIAEFILLGMLEFQIRLMRDYDPFMRENSFGGRSIVNGPMRKEMRDATVGIVGYGHIGREVARRCKAFGMNVMAVSRTKRDEPDLVDWYGTNAELDKLLSASDFVVVCAPLSDETEGMIGAAQFDAMKDDGVIINVGRGPVIDEAALYRALTEKRIGGAVIDVWWVNPSRDARNPRGSIFPFHRLDNVILSPHSSAWSAEMLDRRWAAVAGNLDRLARGEELINVRHIGGEG